VTNFTEQAPRISPDGHWVTYQSDESGRYEVYVRPFPGPGAHSPVSVGGGTLPLWSRDGHTIFFTNGSQLVAAPVATHPTLSVGRREVLFTGNFLTGAGHAQYDVAPDGRSFLMLQPVVGTGEQIVVIYNWAAELHASVKDANRP
jgi:eukaryotic-like serine/threonine-protein kinase